MVRRLPAVVFLAAATAVAAMLALTATPTLAGAPATTTTAPTTTQPPDTRPVASIIGFTPIDVLTRVFPCFESPFSVGSGGSVTVHRTGDTTWSERIVMFAEVAELPGEQRLLWVDVPAGSSDATTQIDLSDLRLPFESTEVVVSIVPYESEGDPYAIGSPGSVVVPVHHEFKAYDCVSPTFTSAMSNTEQSIQVGESLAPLEFFVPPEVGALTWILESGALPPGISFGALGTFLGTAEQKGTWVAVIGVCTRGESEPLPPSAHPDQCAMTQLRVTVGTRVDFPATG